MRHARTVRDVWSLLPGGPVPQTPWDVPHWGLRHLSRLRGMGVPAAIKRRILGVRGQSSREEAASCGGVVQTTRGACCPETGPSLPSVANRSSVVAPGCVRQWPAPCATAQLAACGRGVSAPREGSFPGSSRSALHGAATSGRSLLGALPPHPQDLPLCSHRSACYSPPATEGGPERISGAAAAGNDRFLWSSPLGFLDMLRWLGSDESQGVWGTGPPGLFSGTIA